MSSVRRDTCHIEKKLFLSVILCIISVLQLASFILQTTPQLWSNAVQDLVSMFHRSDSPDLQVESMFHRSDLPDLQVAF